MSGPCTARGGAGTRFTYAELEGLWINAGGSKSYAPLMAAIAEAESSGCSSAQNPGGACGLWQINPPQSGCFNPATNAKMAVAKLKSQGLAAWATYTNGAYKQFLKGSVPPNLNVNGGQGATLTADTSSSCLIPIPQAKIPLVNIPVSPGGCLISRSEARAAAGVAILVGGSLVMGLGLILLAAYGLKATGASQTAGRALELGGVAAAAVGAPEAGLAVAGAGKRVRSQGAVRAGERASLARARKAAPAGRAVAGPGNTGGERQTEPGQA
jgi:Transglycosylase SLT domain